MTNASTENNLPEITLDRVVEAMRTFDIELTKMDSDIEAATANLNGLPCSRFSIPWLFPLRCAYRRRLLQRRCRPLPRG